MAQRAHFIYRKYWTNYNARDLILYSFAIVSVSVFLFLHVNSGDVPGNLPCCSDQSTDQRFVDSIRRIHSFRLVYIGLLRSLRDLGAILRS